MAKEKKARRQKRSAVVRWHRWVGMFAFVILVVVAITGFALNHSAGLNLDGRLVGKEWLMRWYGMEAEGDPVAFAAGGVRMAGWDGSLWFGERHLDIEGELAGAVERGEEIAVACRDAIYLFDREGALLEKMSPALLPEGEIERIGLDSKERDLAIRAGGVVSVFRGGFFDEAGESPGVQWAEKAEISAEDRRELAVGHRGEGLPLYRVILDLHSGKFFGTAGVVIYDLAAVAVLLLSGTGLWLAVRNFYRSGKGGSSRKS